MKQNKISSNHHLNTNDRDHIYFELSFQNNTGGDQPLRLYETRTDPIIDIAEDFNVSLVKFNIPTTTIPILYAQPINNQANPLLLPQAVTIINGATLAQSTVNVLFVPSSNVPVPTLPASGIWPPNSPFHQIRTYDAFVDMINTAAATAMGNVGLVAANAPKLFFDVAEKIFKIEFVASFLDATAGHDSYFFNDVLIHLFTNFNEVIDINNLPTTFARIKVVSRPNTISGANFIMEQNNISLYSLNFPRAIIVTTNSIPIVQQGISNVSFLQNNSNDNTRNILTDFNPDLNTNIRNVLQYIPPGEYRMIDLHGSSPIYSIELQFFWRDLFGNLFPLLIRDTNAGDLTILFRRKGVVD